MIKTQRERLVTLSPVEWTPQIGRWVTAQIIKNLWRFDRVDGFDDVMQEARLLFFKLQRTYPEVDQPAHLFSLFKTSLNRMFIDKARKRQTAITEQPLEECTEGMLPNSPLINGAHLSLILEELPSELKTVLGALTSGRVRLMVDRRTKKPRIRENYNQRLKRKFSLTIKNPIGELKASLSNI
jgi:hypothetical protein